MLNGEEILIQPPQNIDQILTTKIKSHPGTIPPNVKDIFTTKDRALLATNEYASEDFFKAIRARQPDGYIIAVGCGMSLALTKCFPKGVIPKGIILADIDPYVAATVGAFFEELKTSKDTVDFDKSFLGLDVYDLTDKIRAYVENKGDDLLKQRLTDVMGKDRNFYWRDFFSRFEDNWKERTFGREKERGKGTFDVYQAINTNFDVLKSVATNDALSFQFADFTNPVFIEAVAALPEFNTSTNIIYLSNIADHLIYGNQNSNLALIRNLERYQAGSKPPIVIDSLQSLFYHLRASINLPLYSPADMLSFLSARSFEFAKHEGVLSNDFDTNKNGGNLVDLSSLDDNQLQIRYLQLLADANRLNPQLAIAAKEMSTALYSGIKHFTEENPGSEFFGEEKPRQWLDERFREPLAEIIETGLELKRRGLGL